MHEGLIPQSLVARELEVVVATRRLIDGLSVTLMPDPLTVVMGQNGAGKSLLLRLLHGLIQPDRGDIHWGDRPIDAALRRQQAMVFQRPVLLRRSVAANIDFALRLRPDPSTPRRDELLDEVGLLTKAKQPARSLSGGEQQRLSLARALSQNPLLMFLDEPTASLDPASTAMIEDIVRKRSDSGTKIVFVSHDIGQARRIADDIVFLHNGRVTEHSVARDFFNSPQSHEASAYLSGTLLT